MSHSWQSTIPRPPELVAAERAALIRKGIIVPIELQFGRWRDEPTLRLHFDERVQFQEAAIRRLQDRKTDERLPSFEEVSDATA